MRGRLWPVLCARWRLSTALFRWMPDRFPFSVRAVFLSVVRRFPSVFGLPSPVFSSGYLFLLSSVNRWVLRPFPVFPVSTLIYMRCFHVWLLVHLPCFPCVCPLFQCLLLFAILAAPAIFPFQFVPLLQCVFHAFLVCVFCPVVSTFPCPRASSFFTAFALPFYLSFVYGS